MELVFPHRVRYPNGRTSLDEVIANLQAQKKLIEEGIHLLERAIPGFDVTQIEIDVRSVEDGSLLTDFLVLVYGQYQQQIEEKVVGGIEEMFGVDIPTEWEPLVTL